MFAFQQATPDDANLVAEIISLSSRGILQHLLDGLIPGLDGCAILAAAFIQGEGPYRIDNVIRTKRGSSIAALLFSYPARDHVIPALLGHLVPAKRIAPVKLLLELAVPESLYINTFWCGEGPERPAFEQALMVEARSRCLNFGLDRLSVFCWNDDEERLRFFAAQGFTLAEHLGPELLPLEGHALGGSLLCRKLEGL